MTKVFPVATVSVAAEATVLTPNSGKKFRLMSAELEADQAGVYTFKDGLAGTTALVVYLAATTPRAFDFGKDGIKGTVADQVLTCTGPGSSHLNGYFVSDEDV